MERKKTTSERGRFKVEIHKALYKSDNIRELLLGDCKNKSEKEILHDFKDHVKSHLFIDDTITDAETYIYYDIQIPYLGSNIKTCKVVMYLITQRDILETYHKDGYYGDRIDILSQMVEETLLDPNTVNNFGIGELTLDSVEIYNSMRYYGCIMTFSVPSFR